jgi:hypothetical protein
MNTCTCNGFDAMWESVNRAIAGELVEGAVPATQPQVEYSRAHNAVRRYEILLGKNGGARTRIPSRALFPFTDGATQERKAVVRSIRIESRQGS